MHLPKLVWFLLRHSVHFTL